MMERMKDNNDDDAEGKKILIDVYLNFAFCCPLLLIHVLSHVADVHNNLYVIEKNVSSKDTS